MAGLSEGTLLVEGAVRSGALSTARWASELRRPLLAVPGPVSSAMSNGAHQLIRTGQATLVTRADEVLGHLAAHSILAGPSEGASRPTLDESYVPPRGRRPDQLTAPGGHHIARCMGDDRGRVPSQRCGEPKLRRWRRLP